MTKSKQEKKGCLKPALAVTGAMVGTGIAVVAGTMIMKDKKKREKVEEAFVDAKNKTENYLKKIETPEMKKGKEKIKKIVKILKDTKK